MSKSMPMGLLDRLFGVEAVQGIFSDRARLQGMLDFEGALARAEARTGLIPSSAVAPILAKCRAELFDLSALAEGAATAGNLAIPMVRQLTLLVGADDERARGYVHWGASSQDAIDTGLILQLREALDFIETDLTRFCDLLARLAQQYRDTPMVARTWMQHAVPTLFGFQVAGWLDALDRHRVRLRGLKKRALVVQFGGAGGTLATLGDRGLDVARALGEELSLTLPEMPWGPHRDRITEVATTLALCAGTLGKIARDLALQMQTEISEVFEPPAEGRGGSSTMPHKRNPVSAATALAAAVRVPGLTSVMLASMVQEHERGVGGWHAEWDTLPEIVELTAGSLHHMIEAAKDFEIRTGRMLENLEQTQGLIFAEAAMMALARGIGRDSAHALVQAASRRAIRQRQHLRIVLHEDLAVTKHLSASAIDALFDPLGYTGVAQQFIDRVLAAHQQLLQVAEPM
jgi:3-carboxy-cis,cis-muconate cycloisomerase